MTELQSQVISKLTQLVPNAEAFEVRANVGDKGFSFEFFATIDGVKQQCYDMIDCGLINEKDFDNTAKQIAKCIRSSDEYCPGEIKKSPLVPPYNEHNYGLQCYFISGGQLK